MYVYAMNVYTMNVYAMNVCICPSFVFAERDFCGFKEIQLTLLKDFYIFKYATSIDLARLTSRSLVKQVVVMCCNRSPINACRVFRSVASGNFCMRGSTINVH